MGSQAASKITSEMTLSERADHLEEHMMHELDRIITKSVFCHLADGLVEMEGGAAMGLGYALLEEDQVAAGITVTPNLMTYLIPTALDVPDVTTIILESGEGMGPWGARGIGEPAMVPTAPAIANAVFAVTSKRVRQRCDCA